MEATLTSVLVIEEHPVMRESLRTAIEAEPDLALVEESDRRDAFQLRVSDEHDVLFLASPPDIILLCLGNPGLKDLKALASLRKRMRHTLILALTRNEVLGQEQAALRFGAHAALKKNVTREQLVNALRDIKNSNYP